MTTLQFILLVTGLLIVLVFLRAALLSPVYSVERVISINRPSREVFDYIRMLKNQEYYSKWVMADPNLKREFRGADGTIGFVYAWNSDNKKVGQGEQEIKRIDPGARLETEVRFIRPFQGKADVHMTTEETGTGQTLVKWGLTGERNYPARIFHLLFNLKKSLGNDLQYNLALLKKVLEK